MQAPEADLNDLFYTSKDLHRHSSSIEAAKKFLQIARSA
jgi:hypothetical protein